MMILNVNKEHERQMTLLDQASDACANFVGSWLFILVFFIIMNAWLWFNSAAMFFHFDPYPYQFFNLVLAIFSPISAALIMMSQNRQAKKDHIAQEHAYEVEVQAEKDGEELLVQLETLRSQQATLIKDARKQQVELSDELADKLDIIIVAVTKIEERLILLENKNKWHKPFLREE
jgi:uncharacterized membrane protein